MAKPIKIKFAFPDSVYPPGTIISTGGTQMQQFIIVKDWRPDWLKKFCTKWFGMKFYEGKLMISYKPKTKTKWQKLLTTLKIFR